MSKLHSEGILPDRNTMVLRPETKVLTAPRSFFYKDTSLAADGTYTLIANVKWFTVYSTFGLYIYLDDDSTTHTPVVGSDGEPLLYASGSLFSDFHIRANKVVFRNARHNAATPFYLAYTLADEDE